MYHNGLQWENLAIQLIDLCSTLGEGTASFPGTWQPTLPSGPTQVAAEAWREIEAGYRESIHAAARAAIGTAQVPDPTLEILYFLNLRLCAALHHVEAMFVIKDEKPVSLWAFPALPPEKIMEWLLTEWADDHALMTAFPSLDALCTENASSLFAPSL
ncbi:MAG: hypothetical protein JF599_10255 [Verrucomicrobia bacterium]|nr:hypothetical protein [Verrucomicrobiota bacterium]